MIQREIALNCLSHTKGLDLYVLHLTDSNLTFLRLNQPHIKILKASSLARGTSKWRRPPHWNVRTSLPTASSCRIRQAAPGGRTSRTGYHPTGADNEFPPASPQAYLESEKKSKQQYNKRRSRLYIPFHNAPLVYSLYHFSIKEIQAPSAQAAAGLSFWQVIKVFPAYD